jgi:hypothetical protein
VNTGHIPVPRAVEVSLHVYRAEDDEEIVATSG